MIPIAAAHTRALGGGPAARVAGFELGFTLAAALAAAAGVVIAVRSGAGGPGEADRGGHGAQVGADAG
jgi:hypothetical protein